MKRILKSGQICPNYDETATVLFTETQCGHVQVFIRAVQYERNV